MFLRKLQFAAKYWYIAIMLQKDIKLRRRMTLPYKKLIPYRNFLEITLPYQTLSPVRQTFVFLGSRCTQPLTPRNAHALRYEFSKWRTGQRGKLKKQSDFAMNSQHTPSLERRIHGRKIQNCMILRSIWY